MGLQLELVVRRLLVAEARDLAPVATRIARIEQHLAQACAWRLGGRIARRLATHPSFWRRKAPKTLPHGCKRSNQDECANYPCGRPGARGRARAAARRPYAQPGHCRNGIGMNTGDLSQSDNPRLAYTDGPSRSKPWAKKIRAESNFQLSSRLFRLAQRQTLGNMGPG